MTASVRWILSLTAIVLLSVVVVLEAFCIVARLSPPNVKDRTQRPAIPLEPSDSEFAADFCLPYPDGTQSASLSMFKDKKPVVLIFASFT